MQSRSRSRPRETHRLRVPSYSRSVSPSGSNFHLRRSSSSTSLRIRINPKGVLSMPSAPTSTAIPSYLLPNSHSGTAGHGVESSASSILNVDTNTGEGSSTGILVNDADQVEPEVGDGEEGSAVGQIENTATSESTRKQLREQLKRSLTKSKEVERSNMPDFNQSPNSSGTLQYPESEVLDVETAEEYPPRQYYVLTDAGKPVFVSRSVKDQDELTSAIGVMQALISVFIDDGDKLRYINAGPTRITFVQKSPLYYVCVSSWREPESVVSFLFLSLLDDIEDEDLTDSMPRKTRSHLEYLHLQILSVVSGAQLRKIFEKRTNFDLRRLLGGAETFLHSLLLRLECDLAMETSSLQCLMMEPTLRTKISEAVVPTSKMKDILYIMVVARGRVVTVLRPKKHSVHPSDLHILLNTIHAPSVFDSSASWLPICLSKYNSSVFLQTYVSFLRNEEVNIESIYTSPVDIDDKASKVANNKVESEVASQESQGKSPSDDNQPISEDSLTISSAEEGEDSQSIGQRRSRPYIAGGSGTRLGIGLVCVTSSGDFEGIRGWCDDVSKKLTNDGHLDTLCDSIRSGSTEYSAAQLGVSGLRHFIYKSRTHVQVTAPSFERPYDILNARRRLITLYQILHDAIHAKSGQATPLKLQYIRTENESVMGWITQPFEIYIAMSPKTPTAAAVNAANTVARWVKREEARLFLTDAPVF